MSVLQRRRRSRVHFSQIGEFIRADAGMIAVVRANELNLVQLYLLCARRSKRTKENEGSFHQNTSLSASWNWRAGNVELKIPNVLLLKLVLLTLEKFVLLNRLNASARNCRLYASVIAKFLWRPKSA